jgi:hypothetical protein
MGKEREEREGNMPGESIGREEREEGANGRAGGQRRESQESRRR